MNRHVVGALEKRGIDRKKRRHPLRRQPAGKKRGVLFGDADVEVAGRMRLGKMRKSCPARHRRRDGDELLIGLREFRQRLADDFRIGWSRSRSSLTALDLVFAEAVKFVGLFNSRFVAFAFLGQNVQQHRLFLRLQKLEGPCQQRDIVAVDRSVIAQAEFFKNHARHEQTLDAFFHFVRELHAGLSENRLDEIARLIVQMRIGRIRHDAV